VTALFGKPASAWGALLVLLAGPRAALAEGQTLRDVVFTEYGELSSNAQLVRRLLSPLSVARLERELARSGHTMAPQPINLAEERFLVYVPAQHRSAGYGLLVFVPPWQDARLPPGWAVALDRFGVIFVSAGQSGNDENPLSRREPLALLAAQNLMRQYPVDAERVYIAGFSGGSRIALRLALAYPDLFRGAILNAGGDPIGSAEVPLPPNDLLLRFQSSHVIYVTGDLDTERVADASVSIRSLRQWCVFNIDDHVLSHVGHEVAPLAGLLRSLGDLLNYAQPDRDKLRTCRAAIDTELASQLQGVAALVASGHKAEAQKRLSEIDARFGGLAAPQTLELASRLQTAP
jgi:pimeloyl-ACP methyl ester carboxylesterase